MPPEISKKDLAIVHIGQVHFPCLIIMSSMLNISVLLSNVFTMKETIE